MTLLLLALGAASIVLWVSWSNERARQEVYFGKPLSAWLLDLAANPNDNNARAAFLTAGTNAVPCLLKALAYRPSRPRREVRDAASRLLVFTKLRLTPVQDGPSRNRPREKYKSCKPDQTLPTTGRFLNSMFAESGKGVTDSSGRRAGFV